GNGMVVWEDYRNGVNGNIFAKQIVNYIPSGSDIIIATDTASNKTTPQIMVNANGEGIIAWSDDRNGPLNIYMKYITAYAPSGADILLDGNAANNSYDQLNPKIGRINLSGDAT